MAKNKSQEDVLRTIIEKGNPIAAEQAKDALAALKSDMARSMKENLSAINSTNIITKKGADSQKETLQLTKAVATDIKRLKKGQDELIKLAGKTNGLLGTILKTNQSYYETNNELIQNLLTENGLNAMRSQEMFRQMSDHSKTSAEKTQSGPSVTPANTPTPSSSMSLAELMEDALGLVAAGKAAKNRVSGDAETKPPKPESKVSGDTETKPPKPESKVSGDTESKPPAELREAKTRAGSGIRVEPKPPLEPEIKPTSDVSSDFRVTPKDKIGSLPSEPETYEDLADRAGRAKNAKKSLGMQQRVEPRVDTPKITPPEPAPLPEIPENAFEPPEVKPAEVKGPDIRDFRPKASDRIGGRPGIGNTVVPETPNGSSLLKGVKSIATTGLGVLATGYAVHEELSQGEEEYAAAEKARMEGKIKQDEANKRKAQAVTGTGGAITGMIAGAEVGGTIGSVVGPAGTLAGGLIGGTAGAILGKEGGKHLVELAGVQTEDEKKKNIEEYEREKKKIAQDNAKQAGVKYQEDMVKKRPRDEIAAQAWDYKYGQMYNPNGTLKNLEPAQKTPMSHVERLEQGGTNSAPITIINQGDTINNNSSGGNRNAGSTPTGAPGIASPTAPKNPWDLRLYGYPASD